MNIKFVSFKWLFLALILASLAFGAEVLMPLVTPPPSSEADELKRQLGERLFHDAKLSDHNRRSCATCHPLDSGGMDGLRRAEAVDGVAILRNIPTLFNVSLNFFYNWDGVVSTLEAHTEKVMLNPKVMNATWDGLLGNLRSDPDYPKTFAHLYPEGLARETVIDAIVRFERSLLTPNSRFDRFLNGDASALTANEQEGYHLFNSLGCAACHQGINIGGNLFQKFGIFAKPQGDDPKFTDLGRYSVTKNERDIGVYRVPSLRNVAVTAPYFHDGRAATLAEAVDTMVHDQLGKPLASQERDQIVAFLQTLTGEYQGKLITNGTGKK